MMDILQEVFEDYKRKCKENPRYPIEFMADENGFVLLFFDVEDFQSFKEGVMVTASTERFFPDDIVHSVHKDRIDRLSDGNTLAHIKAKVE